MEKDYIEILLDQYQIESEEARSYCRNWIENSEIDPEAICIDVHKLERLTIKKKS